MKGLSCQKWNTNHSYFIYTCCWCNSMGWGLLLRDQQDKETIIAITPDIILPSPVIDDGDLGTTDITIDPSDTYPYEEHENDIEKQDLDLSTESLLDKDPSSISEAITPSTVVTKDDKMSKVMVSPPLQGGTRYWVQAGSFSSLARATAAASALEGLGLSGGIETITQGDRILYRLRFGAWMSVEEAERFRDYLRNQPVLRRAFWREK